uniref:Uncharacterized protein n=1 Tax=Arundo donax TaxID=35708 RepID=A0A0A9GPG8_ARUDO
MPQWCIKCLPFVISIRPNIIQYQKKLLALQLLHQFHLKSI